MDWTALLLAMLALAMLLALAALISLLRALLQDAVPVEDNDLAGHGPRRRFFDFLGPLAWWRREATTRLFYQRDARGRFRKIRRH